MEWILFYKGILLGLSIAAPVGPIGVLCIRRTLAKGRTSGLLSGLGTATADALYGCIAAFGITAVSVFLVEQQSYLRLVGGLFLLYLGITTFRSSPAVFSSKEGRQSFTGDYASAFFLTLTNPMTIISFAGVFAGLGVGAAGVNYQSAACMVLGVFLGSMLWWLLLSTAVDNMRTRFDQQRLSWVNRVSGIIIAAFGVFSLFVI